MNPLVSVVIPAFNAEDYVERTVHSVLGQTYRHIEVVVVDDGSHDKTPDIVATISDQDRRLTLVRQDNGGPSAARNRGLEQASGSLIAFLDADDRWDPCKLEHQVCLIESHQDCVVVGSPMRYESPDGRILGVAGFTALSAQDRTLVEQGRLMPFPLSSILFRRSAVEQVAGFDESLPFAQDLDLLARVSHLGVVAVLEECMGSYTIHGASISAHHLRAQRMEARFIRERLADPGFHQSFDEFRKTYRPSLAQVYGDTVQALYRRTGEHVAAGRKTRAALTGVGALMLGPRYALHRLIRQRKSLGRQGRNV